MENNDNEFEEPNYYNYTINNLMKDYSNNECSQIILCVYTINTNGKYPFIQYLLSNNGFDIMSLPVVPVFSGFNNDTLVSYSKVFLSGILQVDNFVEFNKKVEFNGYYEFEKSMYLFFDTTNYQLNVENSSSLFVLPDEIINHGKVCNIPISKDSTRFFVINDSFNYLHNKNKEEYEIPVVGFVGKQTPEKSNFTYIFGESPKNKSAVLGPYYYFTNFNYAIRQGGWSNNYKPERSYNKLITDNENGRYLKGGIIRFALFTGNTKYIENMPNSPIDESEIKNQKLNDILFNKNYEIQTLRISDHDGTWTRIYDSVYLGNQELDDGSFLEETPMIVLKDYNQQIPLSYHFIDKNSLGNKYDSNNDTYRIV